MYEKIKAEIERLQRKLTILSQSENVELLRDAAIQNGAYEHLLSFIESLEKKDSIYFTDGEVSLGDASSDKEQSPKIRGWVGRDKDGSLFLYLYKPKRDLKCFFCSGNIYKRIKRTLFQDLKWDDEPIEVELMIHRVEK